jgi:hypothetical protein
VAQLTPREPQVPALEHAEEPPPWVARSPLRDDRGPPPTYSRWRAGPTTFGPVGRISITLVLLTLFPWDAFFTLNPMRLWFMLGFSVFASYVLRHTWRRERVMEEPRPRVSRGLRARIDARGGPLAYHVDARLLLAAVGLVAAGALVYAWTSLERVGRFGIVAVAVCGLGAVAWSWWTEA